MVLKVVVVVSRAHLLATKNAAKTQTSFVYDFWFVRKPSGKRPCAERPSETDVYRLFVDLWTIWDSLFVDILLL